jgi:Uma2 family endonuclease
MSGRTTARIGKKRRRVTSVAELFPPQGQWTEEDYFALPDRNRYVELSEGEVIVPPHPTNRHQVAVLELAVRLRQFVLENGLGYVRIAPLPVRLWPGKIREPDIFFISKEHADRIGEQVCGAPDLIMEVTSPSTARSDRMEKFQEYAQAGVREYWIVDPDARTVEVYGLEKGAYVLRGKWGPGEVASSGLLPGFEVRVDEVVGGG